MKKLLVVSTFFALLMSVSSAFAQCANPIGWSKVDEKMISISERLCIYERNGIRLQKVVVNGFCPLNPCM